MQIPSLRPECLIVKRVVRPPDSLRRRATVARRWTIPDATPFRLERQGGAAPALRSRAVKILSGST
ncbi:MAG: hypothetical protein BroJett003_16460 [Planctomycetota bacterium]|nr:MAG: hypothetical protein BroJett003_16460 [Planctomycetota bacterium]